MKSFVVDQPTVHGSVVGESRNYMPGSIRRISTGFQLAGRGKKKAESLR